MPRLKGIERIRNQFDVVRVRCCDDQRQRKPPGVRQQAALYALFPSVLRIATCFFVPDSGDLVIQPSIDNQDQSMLSRCSQASKPICQKRSKMPESCHSLKRRCAGLDEHIPVAFRQPVLRKKNMASMAARLSTRFRYVSSGWLVLCSGIPGHFFRLDAEKQ